jgi:MFS family permease
MNDIPENTRQTSTRPLPLNVRLLGWASLLNDVASEMIFPLLPLFLMSVLGGSRLVLGAMESAADSAASLVKLFSGAWSDRVRSRKGLVVYGYALAAVVRPLIGLAAAPWQVLGLRVADRIGKGVRNSPRDAMIADSTEPAARGRAFGFNRAMDHLGAAVGPALATCFLLVWPGKLSQLFLLTALPGLLVVALLIIGLRETETRTPSKKPLVLTLRPLGRKFRWYLIALGIFTLGNSSDAFLLVRAGELDVPTALLPLLWSAFHIVKSGGNILAGRAVNRLGPRAMILVGWLVYAGVYLLFALATQAWHVWLLFLVYGLFFAMTDPAERTLVANLVGPEHRGLAYGWYNLAIGITALPASIVFGAIYEQWGVTMAFGWGSMLALSAAVLLAAGSLSSESN